MRAQVFDQYGGLDVLDLREVAAPVPGAGEVLVRVAFVSVNPIEWKIRSGAFAAMLPMTFPVVLGNEVSGVVTRSAQTSTNTASVTASRASSAAAGTPNTW